MYNFIPKPLKSMKYYYLKYQVFIFISCFLILTASCKKEFLEKSTSSNDIKFPITDREKELTSLTQEIENVLDSIYQKPEVLNEVNAAIYSGFETDESISIKNLLQPDDGSLYHFPSFTKQDIIPGSFYKYFKAEVSNGNYPLINKYYSDYLNANKNSNVSSSSTNKDAVTGSVSALSNADWLQYEIWVVNSVRIYFPYSENFASRYQPNNPDINNDALHLVTTVAADRDADSSPNGKEPYLYDPGNGRPLLIKFRIVNVDDSYAESKPLHVVNVSNGEADPLPPATPPPTTGPIYKVWISWVRCNKQYDRLISFTGNGGGSELRFANGYAYQDANTAQVIPNYTFAGANLSRKDIRKNRWVHPFQLWNTNWKTEQISNMLGIWEDDTQGSVTFTGSVSGKFLGITSTVGVSITKPSQDAIIRNLLIDRDYFFRDGANDQGFGFQDNWPIRDGSSTVSYTMPYQIVP